MAATGFNWPINLPPCLHRQPDSTQIAFSDFQEIYQVSNDGGPVGPKAHLKDIRKWGRHFAGWQADLLCRLPCSKSGEQSRAENIGPRDAENHAHAGHRYLPRLLVVA